MFDKISGPAQCAEFVRELDEDVLELRLKLSSDLINVYAERVTNERSGDVVDATLRDFAKGQKLFARFTLVKILGRGGMGIVWLARDEELEREVALKFLPDLIVHDRAALNELKRETNRSLELTHKNVVRIYDLVHDERSACISMEYVDGDTLSNLRAEKDRKVFEPNELAGWTGQLCDALDYAHNHARIIHRDLKPANLMVNQRNDLKVSDFGIARSLGDTASRLTMENMRSGTLVYMSPQQLDGERGTHLDDIYSLGATLYDLLTSKPPFYSGNVDRQVHERVAPSMTERRKDLNIEPASVPASWEETVAACLAKDPTKRPQSTAEVANRLQLHLPQTRSIARRLAQPRRKTAIVAGVVAVVLIAVVGWYFGKSKPHAKPPVAASSATPAVSGKSIAVLPFDSFSEDKENAYFADGVQDDILTDLAKVADLKVISRRSVAQYRGSTKTVREIGQALGVAYVLEGSVRRAAGMIHITAQLIDARSEAQTWAEKYDRAVADVFAIQSEISQSIVTRLKAALSPAEKASIEQQPTQDLEAYDLYLRAKELVRDSADAMSDPKSEEKMTAAVTLLEKAVARDPKFALAFCLLTEANVDLYWITDEQNKAYVTRAEAALHEALRLAPDAGETHHAQAVFLYRAHRDYNHAMEELKIATRLLPNNADVFILSAQIERRLGRWAEAAQHFLKATELDPRNTLARGEVCRTYTMTRRYMEAIQFADRAIAYFPEAATIFQLRKGEAALGAGDTKTALAAFNAISPNDRNTVSAFLLRFKTAVYERNYDEARRAIPTRLQLAHRETLAPDSLFEAEVASAEGDMEKARAAFLEARNGYETRLRDYPQDAGYISTAALVDASLGRKEEALREIEKAVELAKDPLTRPGILVDQAVVYYKLGDRDQALQQLAELAKVPNTIEYGDLRLNPEWDPMRGDPRFERIVTLVKPK